MAKVEESLVVDNLVGIEAFDVEGVIGDPVVCRNAGKGDVEASIGDCLGDPEEQTDVVAGAHLDNGAFEREFVIDVNRGWYRGGEEFGAGVKNRGFWADGTAVDLGKKITVFDEGGANPLVEFGLGFFEGESGRSGVRDVKGIHRDMIVAGDSLGTEDVESGEGEGTGELVE